MRSITTGDGHTEYTPIGHTTNLASRMQALAPTGSIATSEADAQVVRGILRAQAAGPDQGQGRQRTGQRLRGDGAGTAAHAAATRGGARAARNSSGASARWSDEARGRAGESRPRTDRRGDGRGGRGQVAPVLRVQGESRNRAGWCWKPSRSRTARRRPTCRSSTCCTSYFDISSEDDARKRREKVDRQGADFSIARWKTRCPTCSACSESLRASDPLAQMDAQTASGGRWRRSSGSCCARASTSR